jgi:hypothetical protein
LKEERDHMRGRVFSEFFDHLAQGDPIAVGFAVLFAVVGIVAVVVVLKVRQNLKRDDEEQARRYGRKPPN